LGGLLLKLDVATVAEKVQTSGQISDPDNLLFLNEATTMNMLEILDDVSSAKMNSPH